ncbi:MAG TPA: SCO family protein [Chthoniobacterales bacterium]|nr:SCO family protein [Chthoniobacterales bacterium]
MRTARTIWGAHAPRVLAMTPSSSRASSASQTALSRGRDNEHARARALPRLPLLVVLLLLGSEAFAAERDPDYDYDPPMPGSYTLPVVKAAADGALLDSNGKSLNLRELTHGRITVLSFIYTRCAAGKACPYATGVLNQLHLRSISDQTLAKNMRLVSMSFDPEYDTPQRLAAYSEAVREEKSGCEWRFATAKSRAELESILTAYGQTVDQRPNPTDPQGPLYHILRVFLIDREGRIRNIYSSGTLDPRLVLADVKTLLLEEAK